MDFVRNITQKTPWKTQQQLFGFVLVVLVFAAMIAGIYLNITSRAAVLGREIQNLEAAITEVKRANADLTNQLGVLLSYQSMAERAEAMGFTLASPEEIEYVTIPGYVEAEPVDLSENRPNGQANTLPDAYTQSLWEWFKVQLVMTGYSSGGGQ
jgi:cell division protein FtsL